MKRKSYFIETLKQLLIWFCIILFSLLCIVSLTNLDSFLQYTVILELIICFILPAFLAVILCYRKNKSTWGFLPFHIRIRLERLLCRLVIVLIFLVIGRLLESFDMGNWISGVFDLDIFRLLGYVVSNFVTYMAAASFPVVYAVTEFIFVK
jgi:hypothetical protein